MLLVGGKDWLLVGLLECVGLIDLVLCRST